MFSCIQGIAKQFELTAGPGVKEMKLGHGFCIATISFAGVLTCFSGASDAIAARTNASFPKPAVDEPIAIARSREVAVLSGGCFWGVQAVYQHTRGVISATSGYSGGEAETAHYEMVGRGDTGHAESVKVVSILRRSPMARC